MKKQYPSRFETECCGDDTAFKHFGGATIAEGRQYHGRSISNWKFQIANSSAHPVRCSQRPKTRLPANRQAAGN
jgi:hypothetical protein